MPPSFERSADIQRRHRRSKAIDAYRRARAELMEIIDEEFPAGLRVLPAGVTTGNWGATVAALGQSDRLALSGDMVWLEWDNGNRFGTRIDELEIRPDGRFSKSAKSA